MASGSRSGGGRGSGAGGSGSSGRARAAEAPAAALLAPQLNPRFEAMPASDLVSHLNGRRGRGADFVDVALVLADRERRHALNEGRVRWCSQRIDSLLDEMREREYSALEAEAVLRDKIRSADETEKALRDKIRRADETEKALRDKIRRADETEKALRETIRRADEAEKVLRGKIRTLQLSTATLISGISGTTGLSQQAAGREPVPRDFITASADGVGFADATGVQTMIAKGDLVAAAPLPGTAIVDDEQQVATEVPRSNDEAQGDREVSEDVRPSPSVTAGRDKVSGEVALEEDVAASLRRRSKGKEPERATKNAPKHKGTLQLGGAALIPSGLSRFSLAQRAAGLGREAMPQENFFAPRMWSRSAPHFLAAPLMPLTHVAPHLFATPLPGTPRRHAAQHVANKEAQQGDRREVSEDVLTERVTSGRRKVAEEVAQGEDVAASVHRRSQGERAVGVTNKKARSHRHHAASWRSSWSSGIRLQLGATALISSGISGRGPTQQAAGYGREPVPQDSITASDAGVGVVDDTTTGVHTMFAQGEASDAVPKKMRHGALWSSPASQLVAAPLMRPRPGALSRAEPHVVVAPMPSTLIFDDERAAEQVAIEVLSSDEEVLQDFRRARVTAGRRRKVSEDEAQGEDMAASHRRSSQGEQVARANKKARKHKGTSFHNQVFSSFKDKEKLVLKKKEERLAKEAAAAAAAAPKQVHCRCWLKEGNMSSKSAAEEDLSQN